MSLRRRSLVAVACATVAATTGWLALAHGSASSTVAAATPIQHLVVIFEENESFDHYFATYPNATNPAGEPAFNGSAPVGGIDNLQTPVNLLDPNNANSAQPFRIDRPNALTCDQNHNYANEQAAFNGGAMNKFPENTAGGSCSSPAFVMGYFDGNTVTGLWNLAQHFTMSDGYYGSTFGPSTPGALNLIAGQTHGAAPAQGGIENGTMIGDPDPALDDCGAGSAQMSGTNIGDLMNTAGVTWGWFQGGFRPTSAPGGRAACAMTHANISGARPADYSAHHEPFMYYASTANQHHTPPSSVAAIGHADGAVHHQYDLSDFDNAVRANNLPQVSFLKAASFEDAHPGNSDPLDEQHFVARVLDELEQSPDWGSTAVVITYDDSDGWYDHEHAPISQHSQAASDAAICNSAPPDDGAYQDRCGPGPRLPLLVVSPYTDANTINHTQLEQASIIRFIEDNWLGSTRLGDHSFDARAGNLQTMFDFGASTAKLYLDPSTGEVVTTPPAGVTSSPNGPDVTSTPTATPTVSPTVTPTPTPTPVKKIKPRVAVSVKHSGRKLTLKFKVTNLKASNGRITLTVKLRRNGKTLATSPRHTVRSGRVTLVLKAKKPLKTGRYTLALRIVQGKASANLTKTVKLR